MPSTSTERRRSGAWLRLLRIGTVFSPAADVVAGACLAGLPWSVDLVRAALASALVYAAGMVLNDHADREEDARLHPERPLPAGEIVATAALVVGLALIATALALSPIRLWHAGMAALVLAYDYLLKRRLLSAAVTMGLLRAANLLAGAAALSAVWPPSDLAALAAGTYGLYVFCVTLLGSYEDARPVPVRAVVAVQAVPPVVAFLMVLQLEEPGLAALLAGILAALFLLRVQRVRGAWDRAEIRRSMTWLLLGTMLYTSLLCLGTGRGYEALGILCAAVVARWISRRIALT